MQRSAMAGSEGKALDVAAWLTSLTGLYSFAKLKRQSCVATYCLLQRNFTAR